MVLVFLILLQGLLWGEWETNIFVSFSNVIARFSGISDCSICYKQPQPNHNPPTFQPACLDVNLTFLSGRLKGYPETPHHCQTRPLRYKPELHTLQPTI